MIKNKEALRRLYTLFTAAVMVSVHVLLVFVVLNRVYNNDFRTQLYFKGHLFVLALYTVVFVALGQLFGGISVGIRKQGEVLFSEVFTAIFSDFVLYLIAMMLSYRFPTPIPLLGALGLQIIFSAIFIAVTSKLYYLLYNPYEMLLIYSGDATDEFVEKLLTRKDQFCIKDRIDAGSDIKEIYRKIDLMDTVMLWDVKMPLRNTIFKYCYDNSKRIYVMPNISDIILNGSKSLHLFDTPLLLTEGSPLQYEERVIKRTMDIILSLVLIIITSPIMLVTALAIKLGDGGPVLFKQIRCTKNNREFYIYKFRSMIVDAEKGKGAVLATEKDPRITPVGNVIRKLRIDELPQLFNVLKNDMSFVGPRPERPELIEKYMVDMPEFSYRLKVKAGITGYAQLYGKYNTRPYDKLKLDLYYIEQYSIWLDLKLILLTVKIIFTKESTEGVKEK